MKTKIEVETIPAKVESSLSGQIKQLKSVGRTAVLAYLGMWGLAYDGAQELLTQSQRFVKRAERRGGVVEDKAVTRARRTVKRARYKVQDQVKEMEAAVERLPLVPQTEAAVKSAKAKLETVSKNLAERVESMKPEVVVVETPADVEVVPEPLPGYDTMTAKVIIKELQSLPVSKVMEVREYEMTHENRVTVLREADTLIQAMPIMGYDDLTVEEIEPMLKAMSESELDYLANYEAAHENRVTLLRAIEQEQEARAE